MRGLHRSVIGVTALCMVVIGCGEWPAFVGSMPPEPCRPVACETLRVSLAECDGMPPTDAAVRCRQDALNRWASDVDGCPPLEGVVGECLAGADAVLLADAESCDSDESAEQADCFDAAYVAWLERELECYTSNED